MTLHDLPGIAHTLKDGLGARTITQDERHGRVEVLVVSDPLATAECEQAIRARAGRLAQLPVGLTAGVHRIDRCGEELHVTADCVDGMRLSVMLEQLASGTLVLPDRGILELSARVLRAVASLHDSQGQPAHGAVNPAHVVLTDKGTIVLTDAAFGSALESFEWNRERLWREFGLALPPAASLVRFDRRSDVTQLGALVLALALRRPLQEDEYPRSTAALVTEAGERMSGVGSALRMWLQQALHLHPRASFASAADASRAFAELLITPGRRTATPVLGVIGYRASTPQRVSAYRGL